MTRRSSQVGFPRIVCGQAAGSLVAAQCPSRVRKRTSRLLSSLLPEPRAQANPPARFVATARAACASEQGGDDGRGRQGRRDRHGRQAGSDGRIDSASRPDRRSPGGTGAAAAPTVLLWPSRQTLSGVTQRTPRDPVVPEGGRSSTRPPRGRSAQLSCSIGAPALLRRRSSERLQRGPPPAVRPRRTTFTTAVAPPADDSAPATSAPSQPPPLATGRLRRATCHGGRLEPGVRGSSPRHSSLKRSSFQGSASL